MEYEIAPVSQQKTLNRTKRVKKIIVILISLVYGIYLTVIKM